MQPFQNKIQLNEGWNFLSAPIIQSIPYLDEVLTSIKGSYDVLWNYNVTNKNGPWKLHSTLKSIGNDLTEINEKMSIWIHITHPNGSVLFLNGSQPRENQTIALHLGWNMVGYPSLTNYNRTDGLNNLVFDNHVDSIWSYNNSIQRWEEVGPSDYFEIGRGYWIHAKKKCVWEVPL
jgi:hypothetical protein